MIIYAYTGYCLNISYMKL